MADSDPGGDEPARTGPGGQATASGWSLDRLALLAGPAAIVVSVVGIFGSAILASFVTGSWFTWTGNALSDLGAAGEPTAPLFNGSLVLGGVLGVLFVWRVGRAATTAWHRVGVLLLGVGLASSSLVGVFNLPHPLHTPFALAYFVLFTLGLVAHGSGDAVAGHPHRGVRTIWLAVAHVSAWVALAFLPFDGIALPEVVGAGTLWVWTVQTYLALRE